MTSLSVNKWYHVKGTSNFTPWKCKLQTLLADLWSFIEGRLQCLLNPMQLVEHNKETVKAKRIILDFEKDHLIPHIVKKKKTHKCMMP